MIINFLTGSLILRKKKTGVHLYHENIINGLIKRKLDVRISVYETLSSLRSRYKTSLPYESKLLCRPKITRILLYFLPVDILFSKSDIYVCDGVVPYSISKSKKMAIIHDLMVYRYPQNYSFIRKLYLKTYFYTVKKRADLVVAVSQTTKNDVEKYLNIPSKKIKIVYNGATLKNKANRDINDVRGIPLCKKYIFYIGELRPNKNIIHAIKGYELVHEKDKKLYFYIAGNNDSDYGRKIKKYVLDNHLEDHIKFLGYVSEDEKIALYRHCEAFIFISDFEGFGVPLVEAMKNKAPVITSNVSSMKEIAKDAGILVSPYDDNEISQAIKKISSPVVREDLIKKGLIVSERFTWDRAVNSFIECIKELSIL